MQKEGTSALPATASLRPTDPAWRPGQAAAWAGGLFLAASSIYIWLSGRLAAQRAVSVENLRDLETVKGLLFVLVCSAAITLFTWLTIRRMARSQQALADSQRNLLLMEQRAMTGSLAGTIAHDMNNILTVGCASAEMLRHTEGLNNEQAELAHDIHQSFTRMTELTRRLSTMGRAGTKGELAPGELRAFLQEETAFILQHRLLQGCTLHLEAPEAIPMPMSRPFLQQMLLNLLLNAAQAMNGQGRIEVRLRRDKNSAVLEVHDSGPGIPEDQRSLVFDAFYTTKPDGHGLGLLSAKAAVQVHRGRIIIQDSPLGGACFRITFPLPV